VPRSRLPSRARLIIAVCLVTILIGGCTCGKIIRHRSAGIEDYGIFPYRELKAGTAPFAFVGADSLTAEGVFPVYRQARLDEILERNDTVAFLVIRQDTLLLERYYHGHADTALSLSFSMSKSLLSILVGCAVDDGHIESVSQPVTDYVPELRANGFDEVTLRHLLQMTSGMAYTEDENPFGQQARFYYGDNLEEMLLELKLEHTPGRYFEYKSGENQLLGLILSRALPSMTITEYTQARIWEPLGMEYDGLWSVDHEPGGLEKTFCCLAARAIDYAKIGRLYLNGGNWNGQQIVSSDWVRESTRLDITDGSSAEYQYQWWLPDAYGSDFMAVGLLGQYVYVSPEHEVIVVRLGKSEGELRRYQWEEFLASIVAEVGSSSR
jgi:CubicO group peptidase (beta-lactamase class C family)